jgi:hypothetical protein
MSAPYSRATSRSQLAASATQEGSAVEYRPNAALCVTPTAAVGYLQVGDAQARNARNVAGIAQRFRRRRIGAREEHLPTAAMQPRDLLVEGHLRDDQVGTLVGRQDLIHPWTGGFGPQRTELGSGGTDEDGTENCGERDVAQAGISGMHVKGNSNRSH